MKNEHNIFAPGNAQTDSESMKRYLEGSMSPEEQHAFELSIDNDPLAQDALDGLSTLDNWEAVEKIQNKYSKSNFSGWKIFGSIAIIAFLASSFLFFDSSDSPMTKNDIQTNPKITKSESTEEITEVENIEEPAVEILSTEKTDSSMKFTVSTTDRSYEKAREEHYVDVMPPIQEIEFLDQPEEEDEKVVVKPSPKGARIYHVENYKVVDYSALRVMHDTSPKIQLTGTAANKESENEEEDIANMDPVKEVAYTDYLDNAMRLFAKKRSRKAVAEFKIILNQYPDDANALFYGAMSYYRLGNYKIAKEMFRSSMENEITTFRQESEFYLAKSLSLTGNKEEANQILQGIIDNQGFYAEQAAEMVAE